jgi:hypothetical protein
MQLSRSLSVSPYTLEPRLPISASPILLIKTSQLDKIYINNLMASQFTEHLRNTLLEKGFTLLPGLYTLKTESHLYMITPSEDQQELFDKVIRKFETTFQQYDLDVELKELPHNSINIIIKWENTYIF